MKETGIIMSTPMMIADLKKTKTQTRRTWGLTDINIHPNDWQLVVVFQDGLARFYNKTIDVERTVKCPYGGVGDLVWLKESLKKKPDYSWCKEGYAIYVANGEQVLIGGAGINEGVPWQWKRDILTGMFMPRWANRKSHILSNIRCERVQSITNDDAFKEGMTRQLASQLGLSLSPSEEEFNFTQTKRTYQYLWDSLNAGRGYPWSKNNWVFVLEWKE